MPSCIVKCTVEMDVIRKVRHSWTLGWKGILVILTFVGTANGALCSWSVYAPSTVSGIQGQSVNLPCSFTISNGVAKVYRVTWTTSSYNLTRTYAYSTSYLNTNTWGHRASLIGQATLRLQSVTQHDGGLYTCKFRLYSQTSCSITSSNNERWDYTRLVVKVPPRISPALPSAMTVTVSQNLRLECTATAKPAATVQWYMSTGSALPSTVFETETPPPTVNGKITTSKSILKWKSGSSASTRKSAGDEVGVKCTANNGVGNQAEDSSRIVIQYPPGPALAVFSHVVRVIGQSASLQCRVTQQGNPPATFRWTKDSTSTVIANNAGTLYKSNLQVFHDGTYHCTPVNTVGSGASASIVLTVNVPPRITTALPSAMTVRVSEDLRLECTATAKPAATVQWYMSTGSALPSTVFETETPPPTVNGKITTSKSILKWKSGSSASTRKSAGDEIQVKCTAYNGLGNQAVGHSRIVIQYPSGAASAVSPHVVKVTGQSASLQCRVTQQGNPTVAFRWTKDSASTVITTNAGTLYKSNIQVSDDGTYHCTPVNTAGSGAPASVMLTVNDPPRITPAVPSAITVTVSQDLRLECSATAKPAAIVQWALSTGAALPSTVFETETPTQTVNGKITTSKSILKWKSGSSASTRKSAGDEVRLKCTAINGVGNIAEGRSRIFLQYPSGPALAVSSHVVKVTGQSASLQCRVTQQGNPIVTFRWTKDSTVLETNTGTLYKSNLQVTDDGAYHCTPVNTAGSGAPAFVMLTVNVPPRITPAVPSAMTVTVSQDLRLECAATAKPAASLQWTISTGAALPSEVFETENPTHTVNGKITTSKIILKWKSGSSASTRKSAGNEVRVKCTANNGVGNQAEDHSRIVIQYPPGTPKLTISSLSPQINTTVTLTCSVPHAQRGNPATYTYTVKKGNAVISTSHSNIFTMRVHDISDAVDYACEVRNPVGTGSSPSRTQTITVVNVPAFIHNPRSLQTISPLYSDPHFKLECIFSGNPTPSDDTLVWNKDGAGIVDLTKYNITTVQVTQSFPYGISVGKKSMMTWNKSFGNFSCDSVAEYDGKYQCSVNSGTSEQDMSSEVTVRTKYPPKLRGLNNVLVAVELRDTKTIMCDVCAFPPPTSYTWYFGNETNSRGSGQNLSISNIQINDFGTYICKVINEVGEESIYFELKPDGPPEPPVSMAATEVTSGTITLKWVPGYDGGYPQSFVVRYKMVSEDDTAYQSLDDIPEDNRQELSAILQNLNASTPYRIGIQAKNTRPELPNASRRIEADFTTADLPSVELQSVVYNGEDLTVVWELQKGNPINYTVQYRREGDAVFTDLATDIPASQNNVTVAISLKEGNYEFRIIAHEGESVHFETQLEPRMFELRIENTVSVGTAVAVTVAVFILVIASAVVTFFLRRRRRRKNTNNELTEGDVTEISEISRVQEGAYETPQKNIEETSVYTSLHKEKKTVDAVTTCPAPQTCDTEIPRKYVRLIGKIGNGASGRNLKGEIYDLHGKRVWTPVAVKTVKDLEDAAIVKYLLDELKVMQALRPHPNVISLLGSCTGEGDLPMIIMEYLPNGNLQSFLRNVRPRNKAVYDNLFGTGSSLTSRDLMGFALDVANGMAHLSSLSILHRDLAARNVLLSDDRKCKIASFGFATNDIENHPYDRKSQGRLPVRWMSPEALFDNKFTTQSDVWAYGVLLWEIVMMGSKPYPGMSAKKVMKALTEGYRMPQPPHCSQGMYNIMLSCWEETPTARPSFDEITNSWKGLLDYEVLTFGKTEKVTV